MLYMIAMIVLIVISFVGLVWGTVKLEQHRREIRIVRKIKADPYLNGIKLPKYLLRLFESTYRHEKQERSTGKQKSSDFEING